MSFGWIEKVRRRRIVNKRKDAIIDEMPALRRRAPAAATSDRFSGVYVHSNPPRVFKSPNMKDPVSTGLGFKKSNIRIWIHNMNLKNLEQVVWEGCGSQLLPEHSNNLKVKKFLEAVPHMMGMIKDIHVDVQNDDLESLKSHVNPPVPPVVLSGKDQNGLTALHKAAGLGKHEIAEFIVGELPSTVNAVDNEGRTPLHYSVLPKDNNKMFDFLLQNGASESALDNKQKAAAYYKTRHSEIDSKVLNVIPECPRCGKSQAVDWSLIDPSLLSANGVFKHSQENTSERSIKEEKDQKRPKRSQNMKAEEINNNDIKDETVPLNGNINEENIVQAADESNRTTENENEINPPEQTLKVKENTSKAASLENGNEEDTNINKHPETENNNEEDKNNTEDSNHEIIIQENQKEYTKTDENLNTQGKNKDNEQNENLETHGKNEDKNTENNISIDAKEDEKDDALQEDTNETSTINNTNSEFPNQESKPTQNEDTTTNGSRTRPSSKNFLERSRQNSSAKSEVMTNSPNSAKNETENIEMENGEGIIEGVVNGENEVEPMNNEGLPRKDREPIESLIKTGNMEHLASLVLNGEGEKLVGQKSDSAELQSFLDNVPVYMDKIHTIHLAARNGNLRDLQAALDRRKFAVARDSVSSNGATPLHIAVAFGRTSIVRYLAGRFPETLQVEDDLGRIPLHYAAMLRDNGHYYNLLVHLGSDSKSKDKNGLTPEYYMKHPSEFTHQKLLEEFGVAKEESQEILNDQVADDTFSARKPMDDEDMQGVLERCYNVLEGRRNSDKVSTLSNGRITSNNSTKNLIVRNHINRYTFDAVKNRLTKLDHDLYDIIWPSVKKLPIDATFREALDHDFPLGIVAPDFYVYDVFKEFLDPILKYWNLLDAKKDIGPQPERNFSDINQDNVELNLDSSGKWVITGTIECTRNLTKYELPLSLNIKELEAVERLITNILMDNETTKILQPKCSDKDIKSDGGGIYYTINEIIEEPSEARLILATNNLLVPLWNIPESDRLHGRYWPYGRGVFLNTSRNLAVYVNILDHVRIVTTNSSSPGNIGDMYTRLVKLVNILERNLTFRFDKNLGYLTSKPNILGSSIQFRFTVKCPYLTKQSEKSESVKYLCNVRGLSCNQNLNAKDVFKINNQQTLGLDEHQCFSHFTAAVANLLQLEKDIAFSNQMHLAKLVLSVFRKRKESSDT